MSPLAGGGRPGRGRARARLRPTAEQEAVVEGLSLPPAPRGQRWQGVVVEQRIMREHERAFFCLGDGIVGAFVPTSQEEIVLTVRMGLTSTAPTVRMRKLSRPVVRRTRQRPRTRRRGR